MIIGENGETKKDLSEHFSHLSTRMKKGSVENNPTNIQLTPNGLCEFLTFPHVPHAKNNTMENVLDWISIMLNEGHIEPSQSSVGRIIGWPERSHNVQSLFIDFRAWCQKNGKYWNFAAEQILENFLDKILKREDDEYSFPDLEICRQKFKLISEILS